MDSANSRTRKALEEMCLMDDALFSKCFDGDRKCSSLMLRIILGRNDLDVTEARTQRWIQNIENHSVKLDIAAKDSKGKLYNIEMQKASGRSLSKRARYYSAMIDTKALRKAQGYDRLPESYVIFITRKDIFRKGQAIYKIERRIEDSWEEYGDGTHIIHVCAANADEDTALGHLVHDLLCTDPEDIHYNELREKVSYYNIHYNELREKVSYYKNDEEGIIEMTTEFNKMLKESDQRGERRGRREGRRETAINMIADGSISLEKIAKYSGLSLNEVESIKNSINT